MSVLQRPLQFSKQSHGHEDLMWWSHPHPLLLCFDSAAGLKALPQRPLMSSAQAWT